MLAAFTGEARASDVPAGSHGALVSPASLTSPVLLSLADAVAMARAQGFDVLLASANVRAAESEVRVAGQTPNPSLMGGPSRRVDCFSANCPTPWDAFASLSDQGLLEGAITRKRALREDVGRRALEAARYGRADAERLVVAHTKIQYVQTAAAEARLELARDVAASLQKSVDINRVRYPRVIDEGQLARVEQEAMRAEQEVDRSVRELRQEQIDLALLLGIVGPIPPLDVDRKALDFRVPDTLATLDRAALLHEALENRPDRRQAAAQVAQSEAAFALQKRLRFPDVALVAQYQQLGTGDNAPQPPTLSLGVSLPLPFFYQQESEIGRADAERQATLVTRHRLEAIVNADFESALNGYSTAKRIVERYESALLDRAKRARDVTQVQFTAGSATLTDLLDAQRSWVQVNVGYYAELVNYWTAVFLLEQAVGKELVRGR